MAIISSGQQANMSFLAFNANLKGGQKSTISTIAASTSKNIQDSFTRQTSKTMTLTFSGRQFSGILPVQTNDLALVSFQDGGGSLLPMNQVIDSEQRNRYQFQSQRIYESEDASAGFDVDTSVNGPADDQTAINLRQAQQIQNQMGSKIPNDGSLESLARDLAVFGLDFTALEGADGPFLERQALSRQNRREKQCGKNYETFHGSGFLFGFPHKNRYKKGEIQLLCK